MKYKPVISRIFAEMLWLFGKTKKKEYGVAFPVKPGGCASGFFRQGASTLF
jgi:hypothetical protein